MTFPAWSDLWKRGHSLATPGGPSLGPRGQHSCPDTHVCSLCSHGSCAVHAGNRDPASLSCSRGPADDHPGPWEGLPWDLGLCRWPSASQCARSQTGGGARAEDPPTSHGKDKAGGWVTAGSQERRSTGNMTTFRGAAGVPRLDLDVGHMEPWEKMQAAPHSAQRSRYPRAKP